MPTSVMLDLETLSTRPDSVVLTLGAVKFNPYTLQPPGPGLYIRPDVDEQLAQGRHVQEETLQWWLKQSEEIREEALTQEGRVSVISMYEDLNKFLVGVDEIWCQGPVFDITILENLYYQFGWPVPWNYWQIRDSRTLFSVHGDIREKNNLHNALADCVSQAVAVQKIFRRLNIQHKK